MWYYRSMRNLERHSDQESFEVHDVRPFFYNPTSHEFQVDEVVFPIEIPDTDLLHSETLHLGQTISHPSSSLLGIDFTGKIVVFPEMRKWIANLTIEERDKVNDILHVTMTSAWNALGGNLTLDQKVSFTQFFSAGKFRVNTIGNATSLGYVPEKMGLFMKGNHEENLSFPYYMAFHNADTRYQRLTLTSGVGTLGFLADKGLPY